jgi:hypothetical protein
MRYSLATGGVPQMALRMMGAIGRLVAAGLVLARRLGRSACSNHFINNGDLLQSISHYLSVLCTPL